MERSDVSGSSDCPKNLLAIRARKEADEDMARLADEHRRQTDEFHRIRLELLENLSARHTLELAFKLALIKEGSSVAVLHYVDELVKLKVKEKDLEDDLPKAFSITSFYKLL